MLPSVVYTVVNFLWIRRVTRVTNTNSEREKSAVALKTPEFGVNTSVNSLVRPQTFCYISLATFRSSPDVIDDILAARQQISKKIGSRPLKTKENNNDNESILTLGASRPSNKIYAHCDRLRYN